MANGERELEMAEADLASARHELVEAERDVEKAAEKIEAVIEKEKHHHQFKVEVLYNGVKKQFEVRHDELVKTLLNKAINAFGPIPNPHTLSLYTAGGEELDDAKTIEAAGVKPSEVLLLRPSRVKGGK